MFYVILRIYPTYNTSYLVAEEHTLEHGARRDNSRLGAGRQPQQVQLYTTTSAQKRQRVLRGRGYSEHIYCTWVGGIPWGERIRYNKPETIQAQDALLPRSLRRICRKPKPPTVRTAMVRRTYYLYVAQQHPGAVPVWIFGEVSRKVTSVIFIHTYAWGFIGQKL